MKKNTLKDTLDIQCERTLGEVKKAQVGSDEAKKALEQLNQELKARQMMTDTTLAVKKDKRERRKSISDVVLGILGIVVPAGLTVGLTAAAIQKDKDPESPTTLKSLATTVRDMFSFGRHGH